MADTQKQFLNFQRQDEITLSDVLAEMSCSYITQTFLMKMEGAKQNAKFAKGKRSGGNFL